MNAAIDFASILLGGLAAGTVLFIVSVGLSVTMGLMGFVNLAHGAFAMFGGYIIVLAMNRAHFSFPIALVLGFLGTARSIWDFIQMLRGVQFPHPIAVQEKAAMSVVLLVFVILCVRSFINARRARA